MHTAGGVIQHLENYADPTQLEGMARFGMTSRNRLGVKMPVLRRMAKEIGVNHSLALDLWLSGISEARILAGLVANPSEMTSVQADQWVNDLDSWDVCDQLCMNLFEKVPFSVQKIHEWHTRDEEFVKRAAYALIACLAWHDKKKPDAFFINFLPLMETGAGDERNYVRKAVSWALRSIGKRNPYLQEQAILTAEIIGQMASRSARWVAADVLRELRKPSSDS